jgi:hypothetical protein
VSIFLSSMIFPEEKPEFDQDAIPNSFRVRTRKSLPCKIHFTGRKDQAMTSYDMNDSIMILLYCSRTK